MIGTRLHRALLSLFFCQMSLQSPIALSQTLAKISDGQAVTIEDRDVSLVPPKSWEYRSPYLGKAMVMQVPQGAVVYGKTTYQKNITVALIQEGRPIDALEGKHLATKLELEFGKAAGVTDFQILEQRFADHRGKNDAILIYTSFQLNGTPMSQLNVFVSGAERAALLTYTDLTEEFQKNDEFMTQAWNAMMSIDLKGVAPKRYADFYPILGGIAGVFFALCVFLILRRRSASRLIADAEGGLYGDTDIWASDMDATTSYEQHRDPMSIVVHSDVWGEATRVAMTEEKPRKRRKAPRSLVVTSGF